MARDEKSAEEEQIKVVDRRPFDADGNPRSAEAERPPAPRPVEPLPRATEEAPDSAPPRPRESPEPPRPRPAAVPPAGAQGADDEAGEDELAEAAAMDRAGEDFGPGESSFEGDPFIGLVMSLSVNALMALGHAPGAPGAEAAVDLVAARQLIDILAVLADKTKGNLSAEESRVLQQNIYDLRMMYVEKTRGGPSR